MPTVMTVSGFRFFFYSMEGAEPQHIHVERDASTAKFWLDPIQLAGSRGWLPGSRAQSHSRPGHRTQARVQGGLEWAFRR